MTFCILVNHYGPYSGACYHNFCLNYSFSSIFDLRVKSRGLMVGYLNPDQEFSSLNFTQTKLCSYCTADLRIGKIRFLPGATQLSEILLTWMFNHNTNSCVNGICVSINYHVSWISCTGISLATC